MHTIPRSVTCLKSDPIYTLRTRKKEPWNIVKAYSRNITYVHRLGIGNSGNEDLTILNASNRTQHQQELDPQPPNNY